MPDLRAVLGNAAFVVVGGIGGAWAVADRALTALRGEAWRLPDGAAVDVLRSVEPWVREAVGTAQVDSAGLPVIGLPFRVLMKLAANHTIDLVRLLGGAAEPALAEVRSVVARFEPDALDDLESLIYRGKLEFQPPVASA